MSTYYTTNGVIIENGRDLIFVCPSLFRGELSSIFEDRVPGHNSYSLTVGWGIVDG